MYLRCTHPWGIVLSLYSSKRVWFQYERDGAVGGGHVAYHMGIPYEQMDRMTDKLTDTNENITFLQTIYEGSNNLE